MAGRSSLFKNLMYGFGAQIISLALSVLMSVAVPKTLGVANYGYWQLFVFYSSYSGFFHFGLNDGIYLKLGGKDFGDMDKELLASQFWLSIFCQSLVALMIVFLSVFFFADENKTFVVVASAVYMLFYNGSLFLGYIFQAGNETKLYSLSVVIDKLVFILSVLVVTIAKIDDFRVYVVLYILAKGLAHVYCMYIGWDFLFTGKIGLRKTMREACDNIRIGINLMLANIMSMLAIGNGRMIIERIWGIEVFGKFSFTLSVTGFFLMFISQISMVLFPALRQTEDSMLLEVYTFIRDALSLFLPIIFLAYIPAKYILCLWLPDYAESLRYMALLLPICLYDGKMQLLYSTYLKVLRKERELLIINIAAFVLSLALGLIGGYLFHSINFVILSILAAIASRSFMGELYLTRELNISLDPFIIWETVFVAVFICAAWFFEGYMSFFIICMSYIIYILADFDRLLSVLKTVYTTKRRLRT